MTEFMAIAKKASQECAIAVKRIAVAEKTSTETKQRLVPAVRDITTGFKSCAEPLRDLQNPGNVKKLASHCAAIMETIDWVIAQGRLCDVDCAELVQASQRLRETLAALTSRSKAKDDTALRARVKRTAGAVAAFMRALGDHAIVSGPMETTFADTLRRVEEAALGALAAAPRSSPAAAAHDLEALAQHCRALSQTAMEVVSVGSVASAGTPSGGILQAVDELEAECARVGIDMRPPEPSPPPPPPQDASARADGSRVAAVLTQPRIATPTMDDMAALGFAIDDLGTTAGGAGGGGADKPRTDSMQAMAAVVSAIPAAQTAAAPETVSELQQLDSFLSDIVGDVGAGGGADAPICEACKAPIARAVDVVQALGKTWHAEHLKCARCGAAGARRECEGGVYCDRCFVPICATQCARCGGAMPNPVLSADGRRFHERCLKCARCGLSLAAGIFESGGEMLCLQHCQEAEGTACRKCGGAIEGACVRIEDTKRWHSHCFVCSLCQKSLVGQPYRLHNEKVYCKSCHTNVFG